MIAFIKTALTFLTTYKKYASALLIIAACALCAWLGSSYQKAKCEAQIADFKAQMASAVSDQRKYYEKESPRQQAAWFWKAVGLTLLVLSVTICLTGCASQVPVPTERQQIPTALIEPSTPSAESFSARVRDFLARAVDWLEESQERKTH